MRHLLVPLLGMFVVISLSAMTVKEVQEKLTEKQLDRLVTICGRLQPKGLQRKEWKGYYDKCFVEKYELALARTKGWNIKKPKVILGKKPDLKRFDPKNPRDFDIYQACMGRDAYNCSQKCDKKHPFDCPQCIESLEKCITAFQYDVVGVENCKPGMYWGDVGDWKWSLPNAILDDRKMGTVYSCLAKYAKKMSAQNDCSSLRRCKAVCRNDPKSQKGAKTTKKCIKICKKWFPKRKLGKRKCKKMEFK